ncbi:MAG: nucleoside-diphosphate sugar epimerase/dehydratase [Bacillota bacterium]
MAFLRWPRARQLVLAVCDLVVVNGCLLAGLLLRFEWRIPHTYLDAYLALGLPYSLGTLVAYYLGGLYHSLWQFASIEELWAVVRGVGLQTAFMLLSIYVYPTVPGFPRSVIVMTVVLSFLAVGGMRLTWRVIRRLEAFTDGRGRPRKRALIVGAGEAGAMVVKELKSRPESGLKPVALVDDDRRKLGLRLHGVPVVGTTEEIARLVDEHAIEEVVVAIPSAPPATLRQIVGRCQGLEVAIKTIPGVYELLNGRVTVQHIRPIELEDLLGREPVQIDLDQVAGYLRGETVLVTGAGGSIGSELCRQAARFDPGLLLLLDHDENGAFETALSLDLKFPEVQKKIIIADIRDRRKVEQVFAAYRPGVVFHAAAHKHVPLMEEHPDEAVKTNVFGTLNLARAARLYGTKRFLLISTDKAVNPTSVMGMTKRVAEKIVLGMNGHGSEALVGATSSRDPFPALDTVAEFAAGCDGSQPSGEGTTMHETRFVAVRFGNVIGSRGSVVPVFRAQIASGGPVTVTDPDMRRYFMTTPEAVQLVIQAGAIGQGGEIFALDMGEPIRIVDLAENMIRLSGYEPGVDIPIVFTGVRPGEKIAEQLFGDGESVLPTSHPRIWRVGTASGVDYGALWESLLALQCMVFDGTRSRQESSGELVESLRQIVHCG